MELMVVLACFEAHCFELILVLVGHVVEGDLKFAGKRKSRGHVGRVEYLLPDLMFPLGLEVLGLLLEHPDNVICVLALEIGENAYLRKLFTQRVVIHDEISTN